MATLKTWRRACFVSLLCCVTVVSCPAQVFTTLFNFSGDTNGAFPYGGLVQGFDGNLYGTTSSNTGVSGTVFKMTPDGVLTTIHNFTLNDGGRSLAGLALGTDGNFYGTTVVNVGTNGTIFEVTPQGVLTTIFVFQCNPFCSNGSSLQGRLVLARDGNFYGSAALGGDSKCGLNNEGCGTVFQVTPAGAETTLHVFELLDGIMPMDGLAQSINGDLYGVTPEYGPFHGGTVFKFTTQGQFETIHNFDNSCALVCHPNPDLVQTASGTFWGTSPIGGPQNSGTIYKMSQSGTVTIMHTFCSFPGCSDAAPTMGLVLATDNAFYGMTTADDCTNACGTIFKITSKGVFTTLYTFKNASPIFDELFQATNGSFYGLARDGGEFGYGIIFKLDVGLKPFVRLVTSSGPVGSVQNILGQGFVGTTKVLFNGKAATFTVISDTLLQAAVPIGATTGFVKVSTPSAVLKSNLKFRVTP